MDQGKKRSFEASDSHGKRVRSRNERINHDGLTIEASENRNEISSSPLHPNTDEYAEMHRVNNTDQESSVDRNKEIQVEMRLENNRLRAKEIRKRKKKMEKEMDRRIIILTIENNKLRAESQMQRAELSVLRNTMKSSQQPVLGRNTVQPLTNFSSRNDAQNMGNDADLILRFLANERNNADLRNPEVTSLSSSTGIATQAHHASPFAPNSTVASAASRASSNMFQLGRPTIDSIIRADPNIVPSMVGSISPEIPDYAAITHPEVASLSSSTDIATSNHRASFFAPNVNVTSAASRTSNNMFQLGLADPNIEPLMAGSTLQVPDDMSVNDHNSMTIPIETRFNESRVSRIDDLVLSLLRDRQPPNLNNRQDLGSRRS